MITRRLTGASCPRHEGHIDHKCHFDRGAAAVEMALVMPLLILMVMGIIDFGRIFNGEIQLSQAAREGARIAALGGCNTGPPCAVGTFSVADVTTRATAALNNPALQAGSSATILVDVVQANGSAVSGGGGRVCVAGDSNLNYGQVTVIIPYNKILFGPDKLSQKAVMKCAG